MASGLAASFDASQLLSKACHAPLELALISISMMFVLAAWAVAEPAEDSGSSQHPSNYKDGCGTGVREGGTSGQGSTTPMPTGYDVLSNVPVYGDGGKSSSVVPAPSAYDVLSNVPIYGAPPASGSIVPPPTAYDTQSNVPVYGPAAQAAAVRPDGPRACGE